MKLLKPKTFMEKLKTELIVFFAFFILTLMAGVYIVRYPNFIGIGIVAMAFLLFNGFNIVIKLIIKSTKLNLESKNVSVS